LEGVNKIRFDLSYSPPPSPVPANRLLMDCLALATLPHIPLRSSSIVVKNHICFRDICSGFTFGRLLQTIQSFVLVRIINCKIRRRQKVKRYIILITTPEETIIVDAHISDCSVTSVSGEPSTDSFRVLTTENPSYDDYNDDDHDDDDVAELLRCFQNVR